MHAPSKNMQKNTIPDIQPYTQEFKHKYHSWNSLRGRRVTIYTFFSCLLRWPQSLIFTSSLLDMSSFPPLCPFVGDFSWPTFAGIPDFWSVVIICSLPVIAGPVDTFQTKLILWWSLRR